MLATGGSTGQMAIWDISENSQVEKHFKGKIIPGSYSLDDYDPNAPEVDQSGAQADGQGVDEYEDEDDEDQIVEKKKKDKKKSKKESKMKKEKAWKHS